MAKAKEKKLNIYKVITKVDVLDSDLPTHERKDLVRAKTSAGAEKIARAAAVAVMSVATLATQDELLSFANKIAVLGEKVA